MHALLSDVLITCKYPGCGHKSTKILISEHEKTCKHSTILNNELVEALMGPSNTPKAIAAERKKNIFTPFLSYSNVKHILHCMQNDLPLNTTPFDDGDDPHFYTHILLESDTMAGLAVKYGVTVSDIRDTNNLFSDQIHERTALRIPRKRCPTFTEADVEGIENNLRQRLVARFRRKTSIKSNEEALFYLEHANMNMEVAFQAWLNDNEWEKSAPPFQSCIPPTCSHEELELFNKDSSRGCCFLVF